MDKGSPEAWDRAIRELAEEVVAREEAGGGGHDRRGAQRAMNEYCSTVRHRVDQDPVPGTDATICTGCGLVILDQPSAEAGKERPGE